MRENPQGVASIDGVLGPEGVAGDAENGDMKDMHFKSEIAQRTLSDLRRKPSVG